MERATAAPAVFGCSVLVRSLQDSDPVPLERFLIC